MGISPTAEAERNEIAEHDALLVKFLADKA
jgi:hypothetical protein